MRPWIFESHVKAAIEQGEHPEIRSVRTFQEAGFDKPFGLELVGSDGYATYVQFVRTAPTGGGQDGNQLPAGYIEPAVRRWTALEQEPHGRQPHAVKVRELERMLRDAVAKADLEGLAAVETYAEAEIVTAKPAGVRARFEDGAIVYAMFVGVAAPGATRFVQAEYVLAKESL